MQFVNIDSFAVNITHQMSDNGFLNISWKSVSLSCWKSIQVDDFDCKDDDDEDDDDDDVDVKVMTILHDRTMDFFHVPKSKLYQKIFNTR